MQFNEKSGASSPMDLMPSGFLCWVMLTFRGMKDSQSGGRYGDIELAVADNQPYARKKLWEMIGDPDFEGNTEGYRKMGMVSLTRMIESAALVDPTNPASYEQMNGATCEQILKVLDGRYVAIRMKIEKGGDGYQDKNKVGDWLTPNEQSSGNKNYLKLVAGDHGLAASPTSKGSGGFAAKTHTAPAPSNGFGGKSAGFGQKLPAQEAPAETERHLDGRPLNGQTSTQTSPSKSPGFNPNKAPGFLANAQKG